MQNSQRVIEDTMRPNIRISHTLNGRVKDYAAEHGMSVPEAYEEIITTGLDSLDEQRKGNEKQVVRYDVPAAFDSDIEDLIRNWQPEKQVDTSTARDELRVAVTWLVDFNGKAKRGDFIDGAYDGADLSEDSWWGRAVQPGLRYLAENGVVERPSNKSYSLDH